MAQTTVSIRMDAQLKKDFDYVCNELGMNMSTAMNIFAKKMTREHRIPFEVSCDPFYSDENLQAIAESKSQIEKGNVVVKTIEELETMENE